MRRFVESLARDAKIKPHVVHQGLSPGRAACTATPSCGWPPGGREAAAALGVTALYSHQAQALELACAGANTLLATPTASGKTLAYLLAFLQRRAADPTARAIFLYPLKALARDQLGVVRRFLAAVGLEGGAAAEVYDGDTPDAARRRIRRAPPAVLITNPDMLHLGIVPSHDAWGAFFERLTLIAIDEAHVYRGVFGAHVHHVLRRLLRLAWLSGAAPQLVAGSATIGAPQEFIETLVGAPFDVVLASGAPAAPRHVLFLAPRGVSPYTVAVNVLARAVAADRKTIAFTKARRITELMHQWLRRLRPELAPRVASYRSGYLPEERREIERRLFSGELDGVISTSALESGIDVGGLDVCVLVGYPGSLATAWQRIGRTGRQDRESLAVLVALPDALDQYVVAHHEHFFSGAFERVVLDPQNDAVADAHLEAAGAERSLDAGQVAFLQGAAGEARLARLVDRGRLIRADEPEPRWFALRRQPQRDIALRSAGGAYQLLRASDGKTLGALDEARAWFEGHPGAIYLHGGQTYRVLALAQENKTITLEPADVDWFTQVYARKETEILARTDARALGPARLVWGRVRVTTFIEGYSRRRLFTQQELSRHPLEAPPQELETVGFWLELPVALPAALVAWGFHPAGSLHAVEHAAIGLFPLLAICDRWDLGGISYVHHPQLDQPAVFVYDGWPGGVGLARTGYERAHELLARTRELLAACPCADGCPACVHSPKCGSGNQPLDKLGALAALEALTGSRALDQASPAPELLRERTARHRQVVHPGVRGGAPLPEAFFDLPESASPAAPPAAEAPLLGLHEAWSWDIPPPAELLAPAEGRWLFFDLETRRSAEEVGGWANIREMGLALAVVLEAATGRFRTFFADEARALVEELLQADRVVGFNQERFDLTVLSGCVGDQVRRVRSLDLLARLHERLGFRLSLGHLAEETLGAAKTGDGLQSLQWVKEGRLDLVERYCRADVLLTAALWAHGRARGYVVFRDRHGQRGRIPVKW